MKLPKGLKDHPLETKITAWLTTDLRLLRSGGSLRVPTLLWNPTVESALEKVLKAGHLLQGLDQIDRDMRKELHGLKQVAEKGDAPLPDRLSRLLILASDGTDRFYHNAESMALVHKDRLAVCVIKADSEQLGANFSKKKQPLKALLITDRKALEAFLIQVFTWSS
jgi:hypothetical protein